MLVSSRELLLDAQRNGYAIGAFNVYNLELTNAVVRAAEDLRAPIFLQLGSGQLKYGGFAPLVALTRAAAEAAAVPIALHLDHGTQLEAIERGLAAGFTSIMVDGSRLALEENIRLTRRAVEMAHRVGIPVEAELGRLSGSEDAARVIEPAGELTKPDQVEQFVQETAVDALAVCIGNVHGFYIGEPQLDFARLAAIRQQTTVPLVLHGTSGLSDQTIKELVARGVVKFNLNTELRVRFFDTLGKAIDKPHPTYDLRQLMNPVMDAIAELVASKLELFGSAAKG
ncbi:MAG TPA: class II fructose-bisphosphate aldolase [Anaerolineae bacterium]|nr:class II fructose-bisphosphate aldolase [Anaerolineae bacterium]